MDNKGSAIFIKQSEIPKKEHKLNYQYIIDSIPDEKYSEEQPYLKTMYHEWRWRFLNIEGKKLVEISVMGPNEIRKYVDKYGDWVTTTIDSKYDQYVTEKYYSYSI